MPAKKKAKEPGLVTFFVRINYKYETYNDYGPRYGLGAVEYVLFAVNEASAERKARRKFSDQWGYNADIWSMYITRGC